jgi:hypothetical protein
MLASAVTSHNNRGIVGIGVFCWVRTETVSGLSKPKLVQVESLERVSRKADQSKSEAVVRESSLVEAWEVVEPPLL